MSPIGEMIMASYYSFAWLVLFTSIIGALIVSSVDNVKPQFGAAVPQH